jgi:hypothetical protein
MHRLPPSAGLGSCRERIIPREGRYVVKDLDRLRLICLGERVVFWWSTTRGSTHDWTTLDDGELHGPVGAHRSGLRCRR